MAEPSDHMVQIGEVASSNMDVLLNIAAKAWPGGEAVGFCRRCGKERIYDWDLLARMMAKGFPRCCGQRIDLKDKA